MENMKEINWRKMGIILLIIGVSMVVIPILKGLFWLNFWAGIVVTGLLIVILAMAILDLEGVIE